MNVLTWVLAVLFFASGVLKVVLSRRRFVAAGARWGEDFSSGTIKTIGGLEIAAALGLALPTWFDVAPLLVPLAAGGLALLMAAATIVHVRRREPQGVVVTLVLLALSALVASTS